MAANAGSAEALVEDSLKPGGDSDYAWKVTDHSSVWRFLLNGITGNTLKPASIAAAIGSEWIDKVLSDVIEDGKGIELVNTIQNVHSKGMAARPEALVYALATCTCSDKKEVKDKAYGLLNKICEESSHFLQFIDFREKICKAKRQTTGWSRAHRNAVQRWYCRPSPLEIAKMVTKCPRYNRWTHGDVLRLAHIVPDNESQEVICSFIVTGLGKTLAKYRNESEEKMGDEQEVLDFLELATLVRTSQDSLKAIQPIIKLQLPWDFVPCNLHKDPELWKGLLSYLPLPVLIPNLCRLAKMKIFHGDTTEKKTFIKKCLDPEEIKKSKLHPYNILMYRELYRNAVNDPKRKVSWTIDKDILGGINEAISLSMEHNLSPSGKRYFIAIDASNSMKAHIVNNNHVQCRVAAACMAMCIARAEKKTIVKGFSKEFTEIKIDETTKIEDVVRSLHQIQLGGTDCSRPMIFAKGKKINIDVFLVFTDKETWCGKTAPYDALKQYRKALQIPAKLIVVSLNSNGNPEKQVANPKDRGMLDIFGFSPLMPKIISNFATYDF